DISDVQDIFYFINIEIIYQHNSGAASARNTGIEVVKEDYVAFLDSDDLWEIDKLELQIGYLEEKPKFDWCHTQYKRVDIDNKMLLASPSDFLFGHVYYKSLV